MLVIIGRRLDLHDIDVIGLCGDGPKNRGNQFGPVLQKNLHSLNRLAPVDYITNSWTRERLLDGIRVQLDSLRVDVRF